MCIDLPLPYEDELLHNVCLRHAMRISAPHASAILRQVYDNRTWTTAYFPPSMRYFLADSLPHFGAAALNMLENNTYIPYLMTYLGRAWLVDLASNSADNYPRILRRLRRAQFPAYLRWCPDCACRDRQQHGEAYWRRSHQLLGTWACLEHDLELVESAVSAYGPESGYLRPADFAIPRNLAAYRRPVSFRAEHSRTLHERLTAALRNPSCGLNERVPSAPMMRRAVYGTVRLPWVSWETLEESFEVMWEEALAHMPDFNLAHARIFAEGFEFAFVTPVTRVMLELYLEQVHEVDIDGLEEFRDRYQTRALRFRCPNPLARHDFHHWIVVKFNGRSELALMNIRCPCGFSFKVHSALAEKDIGMSDIHSVNLYGALYEKYVLDRVNQEANITQISRELNIPKSSVMVIAKACVARGRLNAILHRDSFGEEE